MPDGAVSGSTVIMPSVRSLSSWWIIVRTLLLVEWLLLGAGTIRTLARVLAHFWLVVFVVSAHHHLLHFAADAHACDLLEVLETCQNFMLDLELCLHAERSALLDCERLARKSIDGAGGPQVDDDVVATVNFETEGEDDAFARVVGVGDVLALAKTERRLPLLERLIVLVCGTGQLMRLETAWRLRCLPTQILVLINGLLLADLEALRLLRVQVIVVILGHVCCIDTVSSCVV